MKKGKKVFVGMSGGVDSSVAAALLKKQGYDVVGVHLKCFNVDGCAENDAQDARRAAEHLGIPFYTFDYEQAYKDKVVEYMIEGYKKGITPNPDVMCNKEIKFGLFYKKAMALGADFVATGHYVRRVEVNSKKQGVISKGKKKILTTKSYLLATARDLNKDQSYFLWAIPKEQLARCLFPVGDYKKPQVRKLAVKFGLHNAAKKDSQGICFLGQVSLQDFLSDYIKPKRGDILLAPSDKKSSLSLSKGYLKIGRHNGAFAYTIGQRHGLGIGGSAEPLYVSAKDVKKNIVVVTEGDENAALYRKEVELTSLNLFDLEMFKSRKTVPVLARVRYRQPVSRATLSLLSTNSCLLKFAAPQKFVAEGQSAVFYDAKGVLLGGGVIK